MESVWRIFKQMDTGKYRHKKGFLLRDASLKLMLDHARDEIDELEETLANPDIEELADAFSCLIHFAVRQGWPMRALEVTIHEKLALRITKEDYQRSP